MTGQGTGLADNDPAETDLSDLGLADIYPADTVTGPRTGLTDTELAQTESADIGQTDSDTDPAAP